MARKKASSRTRKTTSKRKRSASKKTAPSTWNARVLSITFSAVILTIVSGFFKHELVNLWSKYHCVNVETGNYGMQIVNEAINLQHAIRENPNNKDKLLGLLADKVIWFKRSKTYTARTKIRTYSIYDQFCFAALPTYSLQNEMSNDYQMNFVGFHRLRKPDTSFVKIENYYAEINAGKIAEIYSVPISEVDKRRLGKINGFYNYFYPIMFILIVIIMMAFHYFTTLPEAVSRTLLDLMKKYLPL